MSDPAHGLYANTFRVGFNALEVVVDFGQRSPQSGSEVFHTRIITAPGYAKALAELVGDAIGHFERQFGSIVLDDSSEPELGEES